VNSKTNPWLGAGFFLLGALLTALAFHHGHRVEGLALGAGSLLWGASTLRSLAAHGPAGPGRAARESIRPDKLANTQRMFRDLTLLCASVAAISGGALIALYSVPIHVTPRERLVPAVLLSMGVAGGIRFAYDYFRVRALSKGVRSDDD
jgi:hypothetical protein